MILEDEGYRVQSAETGRHAIEAVTLLPADETPDPPPDLILIDLREDEEDAREIAALSSAQRP